MTPCSSNWSIKSASSLVDLQRLKWSVLVFRVYGVPVPFPLDFAELAYKRCAPSFQFYFDKTLPLADHKTYV